MLRWLAAALILGLAAAALANARLAVATTKQAATVNGSDWDARGLERIRKSALGLPPVPIPADNPPTIEKVALGRKLFFDRRLSVDNTMSCGMCHIPEQGFTNNELATPVGVEGRSVRRNAPTVLNSAYVDRLFHDGRENALETQIFGPLLAHNEMANPAIGWLVAKIASFADYQGWFERAFGAGPSIGRIGAAIASWQRTMVAGNSPFDRWYYAGQKDALSEQQQRGFGLFAGKARCINCHTISEEHTLFADHSFHDTGIGYFNAHLASRDEREPDLGRYEITLEEDDKWRFRTPSLRNVALTAPYMHDGSLNTLEEVIRFYDRGGNPHPGLDPLLHPLNLTDEEVATLAAFLRGLTSDDIAALIADARSIEVGN